ncbi:MAG: tetratricopeptide repeat protein [Acidobacteriota bacterium]
MSRPRKTTNQKPPRRATILVAAILGLLLAAGGLYLWTSEREAERAERTEEVLTEARSLYGEKSFDEGIDLLQAHLLEDPEVESPALHQLLGVMLGVQGRLPESTVELERAQELDPDNLDTLFNLGQTYLAVDRHEEGQALLRRVLERDTGRADAAWQLGRSLQLSGNLEDAERRFRQAIEVGLPGTPTVASASFGLGTVLRQRDALEEAAEAFRTTLAIMPRHLGAMLNLGQVLGRLGKEVESRQLLARHAELARADDERDLVERTAQLDGAGARDHLTVAEQRAGRGDLEGAIEAYRQALALAPTDEPAALGLGRALIERGDLVGAQDILVAAAQQHPQSVDAHFYLAMVHHLAGDFESSRKLVQRSHELGTWQARHYLFLGNAFLRTGFVEDARMAYQKATELAPERPAGWYQLAFARVLQEAWPDARTAIAEVIKLEPGDGDTRLLAGIIAWQLGDREAAELELRKAVVARRVLRFDADSDDRSLRLFDGLPGAEEPLGHYREIRDQAPST